MNHNSMLLAFADLRDEQVAPACDIAGLRQSFKRYRARRVTGVGALCVCLLAALSAAALRLPDVFQQTPVVLPPDSTLSQPVFTTEPGTTQPDRNNEPTSGDPVAATTGYEPRQEEASRRGTDAPSPDDPTEPAHGAAPETETGPEAPTPDTTDGGQAEPAPATDPPTAPADEAAFYCRYTYFLDGSAFSAYLPGKVVEEAMVGDRLEDATATGVYIYSDGRTEGDETLRCRIFAITGVDPDIAVCVRFIDKGKGLTTDHYYLRYNPEADTSAVAAYIIHDAPVQQEGPAEE